MQRGIPLAYLSCEYTWPTVNSDLANFTLWKEGTWVLMEDVQDIHANTHRESRERRKSSNKVNEAGCVIIFNRVMSLNGTSQFTKRVHGLPHLDFTVLPWDGSDEVFFSPPERCVAEWLEASGFFLGPCFDNPISLPDLRQILTLLNLYHKEGPFKNSS